MKTLPDLEREQQRELAKCLLEGGLFRYQRLGLGLSNAGYIENIKGAFYRITPKGLEFLTKEI